MFRMGILVVGCLNPSFNCANNLSKRGIWELPFGIGTVLISSNVLKDNHIDPYGYHIKVS